MNPNFTRGQKSAFATLRRLAQPRRDAEQCEFCGAPLGLEHRHLLEREKRQIVCVCEPCALRFEGVIGRWKLIPREVRALNDFRPSNAQWDALALPINLAFFFRDGTDGALKAFYPSPAGATESLLPLGSWRAWADDNPAIAGMEPEVEALLANRLAPPGQYYVAPIDVCFELVGLIRVHWRGFSGGETVWAQIENYFQRLHAQARDARQVEAAHA